jgi:anion-transporting  ArsA/GET3 family ATPase
VVLDRLLGKRVLFVSGKGGVGKSTTGLALALAAAARGKRALLVEVDAPVDRPHDVAEGVTAVNLRPDAVMAEYVRRVVKIDLLARRVLESPIYQRFFAAAPGLRELMVLGKIMTLEEERSGFGRAARHDLVIVDCPATGHGLSFLKVPLAAAEAVPVGPIGVNARRILALLRDRKRSGLVVVAIPEEMAVVEAGWFHRTATADVGISCDAVVMNQASEPRFTREEEAEILAHPSPAYEAARRQVRRLKRTRFFEKRLREGIAAPFVSLPFLYADPLGRAELDELAARFEAA